MRLVLVSQEYPPSTGHGGIATQTAAKATQLAARGHRVTVISSSIDGSRSTTVEGGVQVVRLPGSVDGLWPSTEAARWVVRSTEAAVALNRLHAAEPIDVVDFADYGAEGFMWLLDRPPGARPAAVLHLHGPIGLLAEEIGWPARQDALYNVGTTMEQTCIRLADAVMSSSQASLDFAIDRYRLDPARSFGVIHTGVDTDTFRPRRRGRSASPTVIFVGRLSESKGVLRLLDAVERIASDVDGLRVVLVGRPDPASSEALARRVHEVPVTVDDLGELSHDRLAEVLVAADVFAAPSQFEGGPGLVYLEAMASGLAVVGPAGGGVDEVIEHGRTGLLVPPDDTEALARALQDLLTDDARREEMGVAARAEVLARFSTKRAVERIEAVYEAAVNGSMP